MLPTILSQDADLLVLSKPSEWVVHPAGTEASSLTGWLISQSLLGWQPAHRLDLGTSGVILFAQKPNLPTVTGWFASGEISKQYQAMVFGITRKKGIIRRALSDGRRHKSLDATTRYRRLEAFGKKCSLLEVTPETGRKHQIRRHLQGIGHAVVGDTRYGPRGRPTVPFFPGRLWLHAAKITLPDGRSFEAPLPEALQTQLTKLREKYS